MKVNSYNNMQDIDQLIENLESNLPDSSVDDRRITQAIARRKRQIQELKILREEAKKQQFIEQELEKLEEDNDKVDQVIENFKKMIKTSKKKMNNFYDTSFNDREKYGGCSSESRCSESNYSRSSYYSSSESHCGESRW